MPAIFSNRSLTSPAFVPSPPRHCPHVTCSVRAEMVAAGMAAVDVHGAGQAPVLLPLFEGYLDRSGMGHMEAEEEERYDLVREGERRRRRRRRDWLPRLLGLQGKGRGPVEILKVICVPVLACPWAPPRQP